MASNVRKRSGRARKKPPGPRARKARTKKTSESPPEVSAERAERAAGEVQVEREPEPSPGPVAEALPPVEAGSIPLEETPRETAAGVEEWAEAGAEAEVEAGAASEEKPEAGAGEEEGWSSRLRAGMSRSRRVMLRPFTGVATRRAIDDEFWQDAEEALIASDAGVACASEIVAGARKRIFSEGVRDVEGLKGAFRAEIVSMLEGFGAPPPYAEEKPYVIFIVGVNGVGKTTTAAKIGYFLQEQGKSVLFAAADTFRAAGIEQMEMWARRVGAPVVRHRTGGDPAAVVFDAVESARARKVDVVLVDTAGRLHTKKNLMDELNKMWRVADRQLEGSPEAVLVIDATTGQNGVSQARIFGEALDVGSIALTKMDGSARGGVVLAIGRELGIPVAYIGVGEGLTDLRPFDPHEYAMALF